MKTKGALAWDFNQPWSVEEIEIGDPRKGEIKVALEVGRHCVTLDHHIVTGDIPVLGFPVLGGHEGAGIVVEVGEGVDDLDARRSRRCVVHPVAAASAGRASPVIATCATSAWA